MPSRAGGAFDTTGHPFDHRSEQPYPRSGVDRKETGVLLQLHLRFPALAVVLLLVLIAAG
jgi:hypothetical protein